MLADSLNFSAHTGSLVYRDRHDFSSLAAAAASFFLPGNSEISGTLRNGARSKATHRLRRVKLDSSTTWLLAGCACQTAFFHPPLPTSQNIFFSFALRACVSLHAES